MDQSARNLLYNCLKNSKCHRLSNITMVSSNCTDLVAKSMINTYSVWNASSSSMGRLVRRNLAFVLVSVTPRRVWSGFAVMWHYSGCSVSVVHGSLSDRPCNLSVSCGEGSLPLCVVWRYRI